MADQTADSVETYLTTKQVSEQTGIAAATLRYWRHVGTGPASFALGKRIVYKRSALLAWLAAQEAATTRGGVA
ncbi:helix-turn-helix domain-containing protein [Rhodococcus sp. USK13]|uniref:helix-turn-helix transcriptional regulator n=1 Tax=Rhodococcus sp. USK13 TaxID=2806442 RepID=UPI001BD09CEB|nr:helix-turn-helix domain-containing protein [Rhodococcus sp. USK13]